MAQLQQPFNALAIDPDQGSGFRQLPVGTHPVVITASEIKSTSNGEGGMVVFDLEVIDGPNKGSGGTWRLNLYNKSDKARAIAEGQMSALCHAVGIFEVHNTNVLHNQPFAVVVTEQDLTNEQKVRQANGDKVTPFTQVSRILRADGSEVKGGGSAPQAQQQYAQQPAAPVQPQQPATAWGGAPAQAQPAANGWGGAAPAQQPAQAPAPAAGWQQGAPAGNRPAWGAK